MSLADPVPGRLGSAAGAGATAGGYPDLPAVVHPPERREMEPGGVETVHRRPWVCAPVAFFYGVDCVNTEKWYWEYVALTVTRNSPRKTAGDDSARVSAARRPGKRTESTPWRG
jgi:hypothetical protein